jgi:hypothetical protein
MKLIDKLKSLFHKKDTSNEFEGRCHVCRKRLGIQVDRVRKGIVTLRVRPCIHHPEHSDLLIPLRPDIAITDVKPPDGIKRKLELA